ncbi:MULTISPECIES: winged helix-turn-helix domain-containing protein [Pseudonocardia]|uniref:Helix-turn-helix domain protein n=2 Tax=Pseudonocardia TaxID=1847 RepID=A0A1Y2MJS3_PSEAH|nr:MULTISPECIES: winged helix-turn-helix domain-containing protein [Pseudonocardia]OSY34917.1 Helix-turn-helix domain protein [Pseudonocardia autotrophica]TDN76980.1 helix-turn-helix protein [Pseudonocardia autotrophica]BBG00984.1 hypothetical protein Pdca_21930 [Pseudonocardia autotrophica]GEC29125.1 hypothetical protein PSA01_61540 [Pseudonocardia saturnea]
MRGPITRIRLGDDVAVRVVADPYSSVLAVACAGVRDRRAGRRTGASRLLGVLREPEVRAVARLIPTDGSLAPDCVGPGTPGRPIRVGDELDRLRGMSDRELRDDLVRTFSGRLPTRWQRLEGSLSGWAGDLADGLQAIWERVEPLWTRQADLREREAERLGVAASRGAVDVALSEMFRGARAADGWLEIPDPDAVTVESGRRVVVLAPLLSGLPVALCNLERDDALWFAAPSGARPAADQRDAGGLGSLLTPTRADLLGRLRVERSMSEIAGLMNTAPATATHQVGALEAAGLVRRRRDGRRIWVQRTPRGDALLDLYGVLDRA